MAKKSTPNTVAPKSTRVTSDRIDNIVRGASERLVHVVALADAISELRREIDELSGQIRVLKRFRPPHVHKLTFHRVELTIDRKQIEYLIRGCVKKLNEEIKSNEDLIKKYAEKIDNDYGNLEKSTIISQFKNNPDLNDDDDYEVELEYYTIWVPGDIKKLDHSTIYSPKRTAVYNKKIKIDITDGFPSDIL